MYRVFIVSFLLFFVYASDTQADAQSDCNAASTTVTSPAPAYSILDGVGNVCVFSPINSPVTEIELLLKYTDLAGAAKTVSVKRAPPTGSTTFSDRFVFSFTVPPEVRRNGTIETYATGPGGVGGPRPYAATFPSFEKPVPPVVMP